MTTASRVMNGGLRRVNEAAQQRVLAVADRLGYVPNGHAASVASGGPSRTIGLVVPRDGGARRASVVSGVLRAAAEADFLLTIAEGSTDPGSEMRAIRALRRQRVAALIIMPCAPSTALPAQLDAELTAFERTGGIARLVQQASEESNARLESETRDLTADALAALARSVVTRSTTAHVVPADRTGRVRESSRESD